MVTTAFIICEKQREKQNKTENVRQVAFHYVNDIGRNKNKSRAVRSSVQPQSDFHFNTANSIRAMEKKRKRKEKK